MSKSIDKSTLKRASKLSTILTQQYQKLVSSHKKLRKLPDEWPDKITGEIRTRSTDAYSMQISDSVHEALIPTLKGLSGTGEYVKLDGKGLVAISTTPRQETEFGEMPAKVILSYPSVETELVEVDDDLLDD